MSKGAMSLLRGYCLFKEMRPYMKIFSNSIKNIQEVVRNLDKKSTYRFPYIENPTMEDSSDNKTTENKEDKAPQAI
jgi:hypothetical protein